MIRNMKQSWKVVSGFLLLCVITTACAAREQGPRPGKPGKPQQPPKAEWVTEAAKAPGLEHRTFYSESAGRKASFHIYLPKEYNEGSSRRFPVIYWLHGRGGGMGTLPGLARYYDRAMRGGMMPPAIIVYPNGMPMKMWIDSRNGQFPIESMMMEDLIPYIDSNYRTIASRSGRILEGFSMGGYGTARLGFKYPDMFSALSMLSPGLMQRTLSGSLGPRDMAGEREKLLIDVYGNDQNFFKDESPWVLLERNAAEIRGRTKIRFFVGGAEPSVPYNEEFSVHMTDLGVDHEFRVLPGVRHKLIDIIRGANSNWNFFNTVLESASIFEPKTSELYARSVLSSPECQPVVRHSEKPAGELSAPVWWLRAGTGCGASGPTYGSAPGH
jgi:enterochelin esterase-like enzyme